MLLVLALVGVRGTATRPRRDGGSTSSCEISLGYLTCGPSEFDLSAVPRHGELRGLDSELLLSAAEAFDPDCEALLEQLKDLARRVPGGRAQALRTLWRRLLRAGLRLLRLGHGRSSRRLGRGVVPRGLEVGRGVGAGPRPVAGLADALVPRSTPSFSCFCAVAASCS